ncbi:nucleotide pyrophosphohydrolase [Cellulosimicrobium sp. JZ28]|uniref:nucleotide pyrophosphohydrolase n=1 Tax=Cellulosimicrobium sp. JZ28 TaxID=1906273 RepID=UPI00188CB2BB|nr:nucleotide pyrophosphohydrolase [Cellulosimicrobium sp. JZ28]
MRDIEALSERIRAFATARDWEQFHTPKNLVLALAGEVGELAAELQWRTDAQISEAATVGTPEIARVRDEMADVLIYLVRLADVLDVDLIEAANAKIDHNEQRYPEHLARGSNEKYDRLRDTQE